MKMSPVNVVAAMLAGAAAAGGHVASFRRGQKLVTQHEQTSAEPVEGFEGENLGMKGQGFVPGFVGATPPFGELKFPSPYSIDPMRCPTGMWQVGCVFDEQTQQQIWYKDEMAKEDRVPMTPEVCFHFCKNVSGVQFMGLRNGDECYCTPFFQNTDKGGNGGCDMPCTGDPGRMCGGQEMSEMYQLHDCNNLPAKPCKKPPLPVPHAKVYESQYYRAGGELMKVPCKNGVQGPLTTFNQLCEIECDNGYEMHENSLKCEERGNPLVYSWAQLIGSAECTPVVCGVPFDTLHAKHPYTSVVFPQEAHYTCDLGYTLDQTAHGRKSFITECQANATFTPTQECKPVICGTCPVPQKGKGKYDHAHPVEVAQRHYQQQCHYLCDHGYTQDNTPQGPRQYSLSCLATGEFTEPTLCVPVSCGHPIQHAFTKLRATGKWDWAKDEIVQYPKIVPYECEEGYTFTQAPDGPTEFEVKCQATGIYSQHKECKPVYCGAPPTVEHSQWNHMRVVYKEKVTYRCDYGYTLNGEAASETVKSIRCGSNGEFEEDAPVCHPVKCGVPHAVSSGQLLPPVTMDSEIDFGMAPLVYQCDAGYSTDVADSAWHPYDSNKFQVACQADGTFEEFLSCENIDDCAYVDCGNYGECVDGASPAGIHLDDYTCNCDSGYEITLQDSVVKQGEKTKKCTNIDDCPLPLEENCGGLTDDGIRRGGCVDLIKDYDCLCQSGYEMSVLVAPPGNKTCTPKVCGIVPELAHMETELEGEEVNYDTPAWEYTCDSGYSLDGHAKGKKSFVMRCTSAATFTAAKVCKPVSCGSPPIVRYSDESPEVDEFFYPDKITYTCEEGYSTDAHEDGPISFEVRCQDDGTKTQVERCKNIECGVVPHHDDASWDSEKVFVYREKAKIECNDGFSLDQSMSPKARWYALSCLSDGSWGQTQDCEHVKCGAPPQVLHTTVTFDNQYYQDTVEYTLNTGYTLNGQHNGDTTFEVSCKDDATFSATREPKPVECGSAPAREKATTGAGEYTYKEESLYTCLTGYSTDGVASGPKTFKLECKETGEFEGLAGCLPVECGAVETPVHTEQVDDDAGSKLSELVYGLHATFKCLPGWATDGILDSNALYGKAHCLSDGTIEYPVACLNVDDCASPDNECAQNGVCRDKDDPTGEHKDDFTCDCDSGFGHDTREDGTIHFCYNLPDCPDAACEPGTCEDLVNDYQCHCPAGYYQDANPDEDLAHDCLPNLCGVPPEVAHATTEKHAEDIYFDDHPVEFVCDEGYTLDSSADGEKEFEIQCLADSSFSVPPECLPVRCGSVPDVSNSNYPSGEILVYPLEVHYKCHEGYSTDQTYMADLLQLSHGQHAKKSTNYEFHSECQHDGTFTEVEQCLPIKCPAVPSQEFVSLNHGDAEIVFPQELTSTCSAGFALHKDHHEDATYTITCDAKGELIYSYEEHGCTAIDCGSTPAPENADIEGSTFFGEKLSVTCHEGHSVEQTCAEADSKYEFVCQSSGEFGDHPDCKPVKCASPMVLEHASFPADPAEYFYTDKVMYAADEGYTLNGQHDGLRGFAMTCEHDCTYSGKQVFKAVECGAPPDKKNSAHPGISRVFAQKEPYTCAGGHSVTGKSAGDKSFVLTCEADGQYHGKDGCLPVECGTVKVPDKAERTSPKEEMVFGDAASFDCLPGFSVDSKLEGGTSFQTKCMADGGQSIHMGCKNMNDCEGNMCGAAGKCVDHSDPTGKHMDDYHCDCDSGFEEEVKDGKKVCGNVPDCPDEACLPGSCEDLVNDYKCHCPIGYFEAANEAEDLPHDCLPEPCGPPPTVQHATTSQAGNDIFFDSEPVSYQCEDGYSLDGAATGDNTFEILCTAAGHFEEHPTCHPVKCGNAPHVDFSQFDSSKEFVYPETIAYSCEAGYTSDGTAAGAASFDGTCEAGGDIAGVLTCEAIACPDIPAQANAEYSEGTALVFPQSLAVTCMTGHALDEHQHSATSYDISCEANGELHLSNDAGCTAISCGDFPEVDESTIEGSKLFGETATVTCNEGYSTDQTTQETSEEYIISCKADGSYTKTTHCRPIKCGAPAEVDFTKISDKDVKVFKDEVVYTLEDGYTLSGEVGGAKEFTIECTKDGTLTALQSAHPVKCGAPPSKPHAKAHGQEYVFAQSAPYTCETGYSLDGTNDGDKAFSLDCQASGEYKGHAGCKPIKCGDVTAPSHSEQVEDVDGKKLLVLVFPEVAKFECKPGFSKDGELGSDLTSIVVSCHADGSVHVPATCMNNNDCLSKDNGCSPNGACVDNEEPTGTHVDDFHCECDSGFTSAIKDNTVKFCKNIPDCPEGACEPGSCEDLVNDYQCHCPVGYYEGENVDESLAHDCLAKECGQPQEVEFAKTDAEGTFFYDSGPVPYTCIEGYTLDGAPEGEKSFSLACLETGFFAAEPERHAVRCGAAPVVASASRSTENELVFSEHLKYECDKGYSSDGSVDDEKKTFKATCSADGSFTNVLACERIRCTEPAPTQENADVAEDGETLRFEEVAVVTCITGHSISPEDKTKMSYDIECLASGVLKIPEEKCKPIDCKAEAHDGVLPEIAHAKVEGSTIFGESLTVKGEKGYSLDGTATGPTEFELTCQADGAFGPSPFPEFVRIECDLSLFEHVETMEHQAADGFIQVPKMNRSTAMIPDHGKVREHRILSQQASRRAKRNIEPEFGDIVKYECKEGYHSTVNEVAVIDEPKGFQMKCDATSELVVFESPEGSHCAPVSCQVTQPPGSDFVLHSGKQCEGTETLLSEFVGTSTECMQECRTLEGCVGFVRVVSGSADAGMCSFRGGELSEPKVYTEDLRNCYEHNKDLLHVPLLENDASLPLTKILEHEQVYMCIDGYSLDGTPEGEVEFTETCLKTGEMSEEHVCEDIDWCLINQCGDNGQCKDDLLTYRCECEPGFKLDLLDGASETCIQIEECDTLGGNDNCAGQDDWGSCVDETSTYSCSCHDGYENPEKEENGLDSCVPKTCDPPPAVDFAKPTDLPKMTYKDTLTYTCEVGYTLDGTITGKIFFVAECGADQTVSGVEECKPVECGDTSAVEHAVVDKTSLVFPEEAKYTCEEGYTLTGTATGTVAFKSQCKADAVITDPLACLPVVCGTPPNVAHAESTGDMQVYENEATYNCVHGYTTTGESGGATQFTIKCLANGEFEGLEKCMPVKCGSVPSVEHAEMTHITFEYPEQTEIVCDTGYTIDQDPDGESTFIAKCESDGEFEGMKECLPIKCPAPESTEGATASGGEKLYEETAEWTCKEGRSTDGTKHGSTTFVKQCQASGSWGTASPHDCVDIDYCIGAPCTSNGVCHDDGVGTPAPGYTCECFEGFEIAERPGGGQKCSEDDCTGEPCGHGGTCTDMSGQGAPGLYSCECDLGFKHITPEVDKPTCERIECGALKTLPNIHTTLEGTPKVELQLFFDEEPEIDPLYQVAKLKSMDMAKYVCEEGYSIDGTTHIESKAFVITCEPFGEFNPPMVDASYCVPVVCDSTFIPQISHTYVPGLAHKYHYKDNVEFACEEGFTIGGHVGGETTFELQCEANGRFGKDNPICSPVICEVEDIKQTISSAFGEIHFGQSVTYNCDEGYYVGGAVSADTMTFGGECKVDGTIGMDVAEPECLPCNCGVPEQVANSQVLVPGEEFFLQLHGKPTPDSHRALLASKRKGRGVQKIVNRNTRTTYRNDPAFEPLVAGETLTFGEIAIIQCHKGFTVGGVVGGADYYEVACNPMGDFTQGNPVHGPCETPKYSVTGEVVDVQNGAVKIEDAHIVFLNGDQTLASATSSANGRYTVNLPLGEYTVKATKSGYIDRVKNITVEGVIHKGQGADIAISAILPPGGYRIVLNWDAHSQDLDSWTYFDANYKTYIYYGRTSRKGSASGVEATLDWDDTDGWGPETTTLMGLGQCKESCLIKFHVDNYSWQDAHLADSKGIVTVYAGDGVFAKFHIPDTIGEDKGWTVFTLDAEHEKIYEGDWSYGPYIKKHSSTMGSISWSTSMDAMGWSKVPDGAVLYGMGTYSTNQLHKISTARFYKVQNLEGDSVHLEENWGTLFEDGQSASCPEGHWVTGLYRTGSKHAPNTGSWQLTMATCTKFPNVDKWGECHDTEIFQKTGQDAAECPIVNGVPTAFVGFTHKGKEHNTELDGLHQAKCCEFPKKLIQLEHTNDLCVKTQSCVGVWPKQ